MELWELEIKFGSQNIEKLFQGGRLSLRKRHFEDLFENKIFEHLIWKEMELWKKIKFGIVEFCWRIKFKNLDLWELDLKLEPWKIISGMETWKIEFFLKNEV